MNDNSQDGVGWGTESDGGQTDVPQRGPQRVIGTVAEPIQHTDIYSPPRESVDDLPNVVDGSTIEGKSGDFIFTVGNVSSGKSTIQSYLIHRLWNHPQIVFEHAAVDGNPSNDAYLNGWVKNVGNGLFPDRTEVGKVREFNIRFGQAGRPKLELGFIEIAGEEIRSIVPTNPPTTQKLNQHLEQYLRQPGVNKRFLFISDATANRVTPTHGNTRYDEDILFNTLIGYLLSENGIGLKRMDILFVISKWDVVKGEYKSVKHYFRKNFPQTLAITTRSSRIRANFMPFSVGEVVMRPFGPNGEDVAFMLRKEKKYVNIMISWIYESFKQTPLKGFPRIKPTFWEKVKAFFAQLT